MTASGTHYTATIPAQKAGATIDYFIFAIFIKGHTYNS